MLSLSQKCSSCAACANVCAKGAISMVLDVEGFYRPVVDENKCIGCGVCERACPWTNDIKNPNKSSKTPKTIAAMIKDDAIRIQSSSGGVFFALAKKVLQENGFVVGVAQLDSRTFGHVAVDSLDDLPKLMGSKYVQSDVGMVYRQVRTFLRGGRKVLFSGTPCQVAALYAVLGNRSYENLWTMDVVCHGTPSVKVWRKFVAETEAETDGVVDKSYFRDKRLGWRKFSMTNQIVSGNVNEKSQPLDKDEFMRVFLKNICLNEACIDCHYGKLPRIADITLGDFWNIAQVHPHIDDNKGTSVVLLNTSHGELLYKAIELQLNVCESTIDNAVAGNPCIAGSSKQHSRREEFFANLEQQPLNELIKMYCPYPSFASRMYHKGLYLVKKSLKIILRRK